MAQTEEPATFRYAVLLRANGEIQGYDRIEVDSNAPVEDIRNVAVNGAPVEFNIESSTSAGFRLALPSTVIEDGSIVEFTFDIPIFRFGTTFSGRAINSRFPNLPQRFEPGQAVDFGPADVDEMSSLAVAIPKSQIGRLIGEIAVSSQVLTPNGDGVNDELEVNFNLLLVVRAVPVSLEVYDLSGWRVHAIEIESGVGPVTMSWNGHRGGDRPVSPGLYVWVLRVWADAFEDRLSGVVGVAY